MGELQEEIGARVKRARLRAGLSLGQLGKLSGLDKSTISRIENGHTKTLDVATLDKIAQGLSVPVERLLLVPESQGEGGDVGEYVPEEAAVAAVEALLRGLGLEGQLELRPKVQTTEPEPVSLTSDEHAMLKDYRVATPEEKSMVRKLLRSLATAGTSGAISPEQTSTVEGGVHGQGEGKGDRVSDQGERNGK